MRTPDPRRLVGASEAARLLGVSRMTLWRMIRDGDIAPLERTDGGDDRAGRARFAIDLVEALIAGGELDATRTRAAEAAADAVVARVTRAA